MIQNSLLTSVLLFSGISRSQETKHDLSTRFRQNFVAKLVKIRLAQYGKVRLLFQFHISEFAVNFNSNKCILPNYQNSTIISRNVTRQVSLLLVFISINATNQICLWVKILAIICYYVWDEFPSSKSPRCKLLLEL